MRAILLISGSRVSFQVPSFSRHGFPSPAAPIHLFGRHDTSNLTCYTHHSAILVPSNNKLLVSLPRTWGAADSAWQEIITCGLQNKTSGTLESVIGKYLELITTRASASAIAMARKYQKAKRGDWRFVVEASWYFEGSSCLAHMARGHFDLTS
jgi:hypothetical protein